MDIFAIRQAIADTVQGLQVGSAVVEAKPFLPDSIPTTPLFFCAEYSSDYNNSMRGLVKIEMTCRLLVGHADEYTAQKLTDDLFQPSGPTSIKELVESRRDHVGGGFGGLCDDFRIVRMQGNRLYNVGELNYVGGELVIEVMGE